MLEEFKTNNFVCQQTIRINGNTYWTIIVISTDPSLITKEKPWITYGKMGKLSWAMTEKLKFDKDKLEEQENSAPGCREYWKN